MERILLGISFVMTGLLPLSFGLYLAHKGEFFISVGCLLTSVCGFQQVYHNLKNRELFENSAKQHARTQLELAKARRMLEQKNKEIWELKNYDY